MMECIKSKITARHEGKQRQAINSWSGRIFPKIKKKLEKEIELSASCFPSHSRLGVFSVLSGNNTYLVDIHAWTCDCRRWQLSGIPCSHSIACFREERIDPEDMVHKCYTIDLPASIWPQCNAYERQSSLGASGWTFHSSTSV